MKFKMGLYPVIKQKKDKPRWETDSSALVFGGPRAILWNHKADIAQTI